MTWLLDVLAAFLFVFGITIIGFAAGYLASGHRRYSR